MNIRYIGQDFSGHDFSKTGMRDTMFVDCDMQGVKLPTSLTDMMNAKFIDCKFDYIKNETGTYIRPLYEAKYRLTENYRGGYSYCSDWTSFTYQDLSPALDPKSICLPLDGESKYYLGYKIVGVRSEHGKINYVCANLRINGDTPAAIFKGCKCRAERAFVVSIYDYNGVPYNEGWSSYYIKQLIYKVGEEVVADKWDPEIMNECSSGIHFFLTQREAWIYSERM